MKTKKTWNFAVVRSVFGDIWIGKTQLPTNDSSIFADFDSALEVAKHHGSYEDIEEIMAAEENDETEEIPKNIEHFIIN